MAEVVQRTFTITVNAPVSAFQSTAKRRLSIGRGQTLTSVLLQGIVAQLSVRSVLNSINSQIDQVAREQLQGVFVQKFSGSDFAKYLLSSDIIHELGFAPVQQSDPSTIYNGIIRAISSQNFISVAPPTYRIAGNNISFTIVVTANLRIIFDYLRSSGPAHTVFWTQQRQGGEFSYAVNWVKDFILGDKTILGHQYVPLYLPQSRSGRGIMTPGGSFRVDRKYSAATLTREFLSAMSAPSVRTSLQITLARIVRNAATTFLKTQPILGRRR